MARAFSTENEARPILDAMPPEWRVMAVGYASGYNRYLAETPVDRIPGWCRGQSWVRPISALDLARRGRFPAGLAMEIATAAPPGAVPLAAALPVSPEETGEPLATASNGWAIGAERSERGRGMLFANPHWFWTGGARFWEKHLTVPGDLDVYGVNSLGTPGVGIGFNRAGPGHTRVRRSPRCLLHAEARPGDPTPAPSLRCAPPVQTRQVPSTCQPDGRSPRFHLRCPDRQGRRYLPRRWTAIGRPYRAQRRELGARPYLAMARARSSRLHGTLSTAGRRSQPIALSPMASLYRDSRPSRPRT